MRLDGEAAEAAVLGGAVLGGGGGGSMAEGRRMALLAVEMGEPELVDIDELQPDAILVTASAVGAPSARTARALPVHYVRAVELLGEGQQDRGPHNQRVRWPGYGERVVAGGGAGRPGGGCAL